MIMLSESMMALVTWYYNLCSSVKYGGGRTPTIHELICTLYLMSLFNYCEGIIRVIAPYDL